MAVGLFLLPYAADGARQARHGPDRRSLGPARGLDKSELMALAANEELQFISLLAVASVFVLAFIVIAQAQNALLGNLYLCPENSFQHD